MRRQRQRRIEIIGHDHRCQKDGIIQKRRGRDIAAAGRNQLKQRHRRRGAAIWQARNGVVAKALLKMMSRAGTVAEIRKNRTQSLMRRCVIRIDLQNCLIMPARFGVAVGAKQQVGQIHMPHRMGGVVCNRLRIDAAGGVDRPHIRQQRAEFIESAEMRGRCSQDFDEGLLGFLPSIKGAEQNRALDFGLDGIAAAGLARQQIFDLPQASIPAPAGEPSRACCRQCQAREPRSLSVRSRCAGFDVGGS